MNAETANKSTENNIQCEFTETDSLNLIQHVSDTLSADSSEVAVQEVLDYLREVFSLPCTSIREITPQPYCLKFIFESIEGDEDKKRIGEVIEFSPEEWDYAYNTFSHGYFLAERDSDSPAEDVVGESPNKAHSILHMPMFSGNVFLGTVDFVDFYNRRKWSGNVISSLKVCSAMLCQHIYRLNSYFMSTTNIATDPITGFLSSSAFNAKLQNEFQSMVKRSTVAVVYTDIYHFKYINETYGYQKGDELLKLTAAAMSTDVDNINPNIIFSRVHSDNFVSVAEIPDYMVDGFTDLIVAQNNKVCEMLQKVCPEVRIRLNTGICFVSDANIESATAISYANLARKIAKTESLRRPLVFQDYMIEDIKYQEYLNKELPIAIENHYLKVYYQPKISCADNSLYGSEALVRWQMPDGKFIYPDQFIPLFEKNGNIIEVDFYVYREVFSYLRRRIDAGLPVVPISMNVSRKHFNYDKIIPYIKSLLDEYQIPPRLLEFELTENIYIKNFDKANEFIKTCRGMGIQISMDDFGSGYSSLNVMSTLEIDTLKIDRVFLKNENLNENDKTVIESMISMAKRLGMHVLCEGVETKSQSDFLKKVDCDLIQGYYYGKPMDEDSFSKLMEEMLGDGKNDEKSDKDED